MKFDIHSPQFWIEQWEESLKKAPWKKNKGFLGTDFWDRMALDYDKNDTGKPSLAEQVEIDISELSEAGLIKEGMRVLDVGCGTGLIATAFAQHGMEVVAIDFSKEMLKQFRKNIPQDLNSKIRIIEADWNSVNLNKYNLKHYFDLSYASMTPAIRNPQSFLKFHNSSRHGCYYKLWAGKRIRSLHDKLSNHLCRELMSYTTWNFTMPFNLLCAMGYKPSIHYQKTSWEKSQQIEKFADHYMDYFSNLLDIPQNEARDKIVEYLKTIANNGIITEHYKGYKATLIWMVD